MDVDEERLSYQTSSAKWNIIDSDFGLATSRRNASRQITVSLSTHHVNSVNSLNGDRDDCDNKGDFVIVVDDENVGNFGGGNDGVYELK